MNHKIGTFLTSTPLCSFLKKKKMIGENAPWRGDDLVVIIVRLDRRQWSYGGTLVRVQQTIVTLLKEMLSGR